MQGNSFLGAFFKVSPFLQDYNIKDEDFLETVRNQYNKKFGRFGEAVVESNMTVMKDGFGTVMKVEHGEVNAPDRSNFIGDVITPCAVDLSAPIPGACRSRLRGAP